jgi:hypothetical protein
MDPQAIQEQREPADIQEPRVLQELLELMVAQVQGLQEVQELEDI